LRDMHLAVVAIFLSYLKTAYTIVALSITNVGVAS
jgi:hypothetical protein